jgi:chromosome segregation ATPase
MSDEAQTKPTIETVLERLQDFRSVVETRFDGVERRLSVIETQIENMDIRFDRLEGFANQTQSELKYLRADFKEFKSQFKQPAT